MGVATGGTVSGRWRGWLGAAAALGAWACSSPTAGGGATAGGSADAGASPAADAGAASTPDGGGSGGGHGGGGARPDGGPARPTVALGGACSVDLPSPGPISGTDGTLAAPGPFRPCLVLGGQRIQKMVLSGDGARVAALGAGGQALVLDSRTLAPIATFARARGEFTTVALSRDGALLAAGNEADGELDVWRVEGHTLLVAADLGAAWSVDGGPLAFSSDGARVAAKAGPDLALVDVDVAGGGGVRRLAGIAGRANAKLAFADGDRKLASVPYGYWQMGVSGGSVQLIDLASGAVQTLVAHDDIYGPSQLEVSGDGRTLLTRRDAGWTTWDAATGTPRADVPEPPNVSSMNVLGLDGDGGELGVMVAVTPVTGGQGLWFQRRRAADGAVIAALPIALDDVFGPLWAPASGRLLVKVSAAGETPTERVASLDLASERVTARACGATAAYGPKAFSRDGTRLLALTPAWTLMVFDAATGAPLGPGAGGTRGIAVSSPALSPDGRVVTWTHYVGTGSVEEVLLQDVDGASAARALLQTSAEGVHDQQQAFSDDSRLLATLDVFEGVLNVFDVQTGARLGRLELGVMYGSLLGFADGGEAVRVGLSSSTRTVRWRDGTVLTDTPMPTDPWALSADGSTWLVPRDFATGGGWDVHRDGAVVATLPRPEDNGCAGNPAATLSPDGSLAATAIPCNRPYDSSRPGLVTFFDTATGNPVQTVTASPSAMSWDATRFASRDTVWCR